MQKSILVTSTYTFSVKYEGAELQVRVALKSDTVRKLQKERSTKIFPKNTYSRLITAKFDFALDGATIHFLV